MKTPALFAGLVLSGLAALPLPACGTLAFPIQYTGNYRLTVTVSNANGSGLCANEAAMTISLQGDGTLNYRIAQLAAHLETPTGQPPSCEVRPTGETVEITGSHDLQGHYSVPSGSAGLPPLTGTYDEDRLIGEYRAGPSYIEFTLQADSHRIAIEPDPGQGFEFHRSVLAGTGFKIVMHDPHGRDHLDLATLKILVGPKGQPGADTTAHALSRVMNGVVPFVETSPDSRTRMFRLTPDPQKLMQGHDIFAIPYNGDWRIELRLCDRAGSCFGSIYDVYFGPFVSTSTVYNVVDGRCAASNDAVVKVHSITIGNIGIDSPNTSVYVGLAKATGDETWTFHFDDFGDGTGRWAWWQSAVQPFIPQLSVPSGFLMEQPEQLIPDTLAVPAGSGPAALRRVPFPDGEYRFITAALDRDTGAYRRVERAVTMCNR